MKATKQKKLETAGWKIGNAEEFLQMSPEETAYLEMKMALSRLLKAKRLKHGVSQHELAKRSASSQSRIAKVEASDPSVSLDLMVRLALASGASRRELSAAIRG